LRGKSSARAAKGRLARVNKSLAPNHKTPGQNSSERSARCEELVMTSKGDIFRTRAATCRGHADAATNEAGRTHWLKLAEEWTKMAEVEDKRDPRRRPGSGDAC